MGFLNELLRAIGNLPQESARHGQGLAQLRQTAGAGSDRRKKYILTQVYQIAPRFSQDGPGIEFDDRNADWLIIPKYPMPARWKQRWTSLLIVFPAGYPDTPPTGFYLNLRLGLKSGGRDGHLFTRAYHNAPDIKGWHWYCCLAQLRQSGGWQPAADPTEPDNLWTFLNMVREALTVDE